MFPLVINPGGIQELMDGSSQSASYTPDEANASLLEQHVDGEQEEASPHIHLPNPSYWPIVLGLAIAVTMGGLVFVSTTPFISLFGIIFVFICIMGWALEDPMAKLKSVYYVPQSAVRDEIKNNTILLTISEEELLSRGLNTIPDDLYDDVPEHGVPVVRGAAQFARRPLSPAETGHYAYGRLSPGMNTDASGSYHRSEVLPRPQTYVTEDMYTTDKPIPARAINPD